MTHSWLVRFVVAASVAGAVGCGSNQPTPRETCERLAEKMCERLYACFSEEERTSLGLPATELECVAEQQLENECSQQTTVNTCDAGETYNADRAANCIDQVGDLTCEEVSNPELIPTAAPSCALICEVD